MQNLKMIILQKLIETNIPSPKMYYSSNDNENIAHLMWHNKFGYGVTVTIFENNKISVSLIKYATKYYENASDNIEEICQVIVTHIKFIGITEETII